MNRVALMATVLALPLLGGSSPGEAQELEECCCQVKNVEAGRSCCDDGAPGGHSCEDGCRCSSCTPFHPSSGPGSTAVLGPTHLDPPAPEHGARALPGHAMLSRHCDSRVYRPPRQA